MGNGLARQFEFSCNGCLKLYVSILVSHIFPYDKEMVEKSLFTANSERPLAVYRKWQVKAESLGMDLCTEGKAYLGFSRMPRQKMTFDLLKEMYKEASAQNIRIQGEALIAFQPEQAQHTQEIFDKTKEIAEAGGISLSLPPLAARIKDSVHS